MTIEFVVSAIAGALLSIVQEVIDAYWPWLNNQPPVIKRIISLLVNLGSAALVFGFACWGLLQAAFPDLPVIPCNDQGLLMLGANFLFSLIGHQTTHLVVKKS